MTSVLESAYIESTRPYSQDELKKMRQNIYRNLRLSKIMAHHKRCDHFYLVKLNGRKEKEIIMQKSKDVGNCSVCWKLGNTSVNIAYKAHNLVQEYCDTFYEDPKYLSYDKVDLETIFYKWLYEEIN